MARARSAVIAAIVRGILIAALATLGMMVLVGVAVVYLGMSDQAIAVTNQIIKLVSIVFGVRFAVGIGGEKGFHLGFVVASAYMLLGYFLYLKLGGAEFNAVSMMGEILLGGAAGAAAGAVFANLRTSRRSAR